MARFDKLIDAWDPVLQKAFLDSIYNLRDAAQINQIMRALQDRDIERALKMVGLDPVAFRPFDKALTAAFEAGGIATTDKLPDITLSDGFKVNFQFNVRNPNAEKWLSDNSSSLVTEILNDQRTMIRNYLSNGLQAGDNPRTTALDLVGRIGASGKREGGVIGLTSSQAEWVKNYEAELRALDSGALYRNLRDARFDSTISKAIATGQPIPDDLISTMVNSYENRALRWRAESIARTETMSSLHEAQDQAMDQAIQTGALSKENVTETWHTAHSPPDKRTRDSHASMDGQTINLGEMFVTGNGNYLEFPGDPNGPAEEIIGCRCWRSFNVDFLAGIQ